MKLTLKSSRRKRSRQDAVMNTIVVLFMTFALAYAMYPLIYIFSNSISDAQMVLRKEVWFLPKGFSLNAYKKVLQNGDIGMAYINTCIYAFGGTAYSMLLTILGAYPLSRRYLKGRGAFMFMITITMLFNAGMIPTFLVVKKLKIINTAWAIILPCAISQYNLIIMRTGFSSVPIELEEAAKIDGAGDLRILVRIMIPLAMPTMMTIMLFYFIARWNDYYNAMIYLNSQSKYPLQLILRDMLLSEKDPSTYAMFLSGENPTTPFSYRSAIILVSMLPMLVMYPFVQRFFVKGIAIGAVKG